MYKEISKLVIYRNLEPQGILTNLAKICEKFDRKDFNRDTLINDIYKEINKLLEIATQYGFDYNLWHCYLAYILATNENPFSITSEKAGAKDGTVNKFALNDFEIFKHLFDYDFSRLEMDLGIDCFRTILDYHSIEKHEQRYNKSVSDKVKVLSREINQSKNTEEVFKIVTGFYQTYGVGKFGLNKAFRVHHSDMGVELCPIKNIDDVRLNDLIGYEIQKKKLIENTEAFVAGRKANNCLLFGDSGTGKSTSIKAILNEYYEQGLRMIEIYKHQFQDLTSVIAQIKNRNYKFIIFMDDLSFEEFEIEYKYLKAVIEGGLETKPDNVLIYATSNRRHLIRETWSDRSDISKDELHRSDTVQEKLSLVSRFGVTINYSKPSQKEFFEIVKGLAQKNPEITLSDEKLCEEANKWELSHGGISGRTAQQFILNIAGKNL
ncbi:ATP-binding protein [Anaerosacchariphilus polymeriproducens]|uniref:ATP-binding protein n=1 Tax=Anaerosacchariphilus polymeriproducens TaxID=1812858 RepID=A0A371AUT4_9FIRM|nr:ATP-binding protein [Anaerosacchariphilus polymeriproducens]RDU23334.1 ATP-binding protein [Anaerosacchariphilus polymeriproducens]